MASLGFARPLEGAHNLVKASLHVAGFSVKCLMMLFCNHDGAGSHRMACVSQAITARPLLLDQCLISDEQAHPHWISQSRGALEF